MAVFKVCMPVLYLRKVQNENCWVKCRTRARRDMPTLLCYTHSSDGDERPVNARFHFVLPRFRKISTKVIASFVTILLLQALLSIITLNYFTRQAMETSFDDQREKTRRLIEQYFSDARREVINQGGPPCGPGAHRGLPAHGRPGHPAGELESTAVRSTLMP